MRFPGFAWFILALVLTPVAAAQNLVKVQIVGVGTSSPLSLYSKWFQIFEENQPDVHFSYIPSGSQLGIDMVASGTADFGASDAPVSNKHRHSAKVAQFATVLLALVPAYNISGVSRPLRFTPRALAGIYLGQITKWNDPAISAVNPGQLLPSSNIKVIHNSDGRGSTYILSDYFSKVSPEWKSRVGRGISIEWPIGKEADGNGNVARMVRDTPNSIGFIEVAYAMRTGLPFGRVQNASGNFVSADASTIAAAVASAKVLSSDLSVSITNPPGGNAYPICSFSWIMVSQNARSASQRAVLKKFLRWALEEGQSYVEPTGFTRLPRKLAAEELDAIDKLL